MKYDYLIQKSNCYKLNSLIEIKNVLLVFIITFADCYTIDVISKICIVKKIIKLPRYYEIQHIYVCQLHCHEIVFHIFLIASFLFSICISQLILKSTTIILRGKHFLLTLVQRSGTSKLSIAQRDTIQVQLNHPKYLFETNLKCGDPTLNARRITEVKQWPGR